MVKLDNNELLNLYFYLSDKTDLSIGLERLLTKVEKELFNCFNVKDIEEYRVQYRKKGKI